MKRGDDTEVQYKIDDVELSLVTNLVKMKRNLAFSMLITLSVGTVLHGQTSFVSFNSSSVTKPEADIDDELSSSGMFNESAAFIIQGQEASGSIGCPKVISIHDSHAFIGYTSNPNGLVEENSDNNESKVK